METARLRRWIAVAVLAAAPVRADPLERIAPDDAVRRGTGTLGLPSLSGDCETIAYTSGGEIHVFERRSGALQVASVTNEGRRAGGVSTLPWLSGDGTRVAFLSTSAELGGRAGRGRVDVFVRDLAAGLTVAARRAANAPGVSHGNPRLSGDGNSVAYEVIHEAETPGGLVRREIHVRRLGNDRAERVDVGLQAGEGQVRLEALSRDGRFVAFSTLAIDAGEQPPRMGNIYLRDRREGRTERISRGPNGEPADGGSFSAVLSADGRFVAFASDATNLVAGDGNEARDVFVFDRRSGGVERVSHGADGVEADGASDLPALSGDGRRVAFASRASNLVAGDRAGFLDVFVQDRDRGSTRRVSLARDGSEGDDDSGFNSVAIAADGHCVAFDSFASNLVPEDTNRSEDLFVRELGP